MIVAIDGPAGAGKSSVSRSLAQRLGFQFLDTGAMYRTVALAALERGLGDGDEAEVARMTERLQLDFSGDRVLLDGRDVTAEIRTSRVSAAVYLAADNPEVREKMVDLQRKIAGERDTVTEGRDQGTVAFPNAECKIFLTASPEERAHRRVVQLIDLGIDADYQEILLQQNQRDINDISRESGGLKEAPDSITVWTDGLSEEQVLQKLVDIVQSKLKCGTDFQPVRTLI